MVPRRGAVRVQPRHGLPGWHAALDAAPVAAAAIAERFADGRKLRSAIVATGLLTASALVVHVSGGYVEAHFHFFVMIVVLTLYEDWFPFLLATFYVVLHHGIGGRSAATWCSATPITSPIRGSGRASTPRSWAPPGSPRSSRGG